MDLRALRILRRRTRRSYRPSVATCSSARASSRFSPGSAEWQTRIRANPVSKLAGTWRRATLSRALSHITGVHRPDCHIKQVHCNRGFVRLPAYYLESNTGEDRDGYDAGVIFPVKRALSAINPTVMLLSSLRSHNMTEPRLAEWQRLYQEAVAETDHGKLAPKICAAETALFSRLQQMHHGPTYRDEITAIYDAVHSLRLLRCDLYSRAKREQLTLMLRRSARDAKSTVLPPESRTTP